MAGIGYAFISAYLKGEEAKMLDADHLNAVMKAEDIKEVVDSIRDTDIGSYLDGLEINNFDDVDGLLWNYLNERSIRIEWFNNVPSDALKLLNSYTAKYDILNIKTTLQNILTGTGAKGIPAGTIYNRGLLEELLNAESLNDVISVLNSCKLGKYATVLEEYRQEEGFRKEVLTDTGLERVYFDELLGTAGKVKDNTALVKSVQTILDMTNLQVVLRAVFSETSSDATGKTIGGGYLLTDELLRELLSVKPVDIPVKISYPDYRSAVEEIVAGYEKDGNVSVIDESIERHKFRLLRDILSPRIMSPVIIMWYLVLKEIEVRNLRLILKAVLDNISLEEIRDYLVLA